MQVNMLTSRCLHFHNAGEVRRKLGQCVQQQGWKPALRPTGPGALQLTGPHVGSTSTLPTPKDRPAPPGKSRLPGTTAHSHRAPSSKPQCLAPGPAHKKTSSLYNLSFFSRDRNHTSHQHPTLPQSRYTSLHELPPLPTHPAAPASYTSTSASHFLTAVISYLTCKGGAAKADCWGPGAGPWGALGAWGLSLAGWGASLGGPPAAGPCPPGPTGGGCWGGSEAGREATSGARGSGVFACKARQGSGTLRPWCKMGRRVRSTGATEFWESAARPAEPTTLMRKHGAGAVQAQHCTVPTFRCAGLCCKTRGTPYRAPQQAADDMQPHEASYFRTSMPGYNVRWVRLLAHPAPCVCVLQAAPVGTCLFAPAVELQKRGQAGSQCPAGKPGCQSWSGLCRVQSAKPPCARWLVFGYGQARITQRLADAGVAGCRQVQGSLNPASKLAPRRWRPCSHTLVTRRLVFVPSSCVPDEGTVASWPHINCEGHLVVRYTYELIALTHLNRHLCQVLCSFQELLHTRPRALRCCSMEPCGAHCMCCALHNTWDHLEPAWISKLGVSELIDASIHQQEWFRCAWQGPPDLFVPDQLHAPRDVSHALVQRIQAQLQGLLPDPFHLTHISHSSAQLLSLVLQALQPPACSAAVRGV